MVIHHTVVILIILTSRGPPTTTLPKHPRGDATTQINRAIISSHANATATNHNLQDNDVVEADVGHGAVDGVHHDRVVDFGADLQQDEHGKPGRRERSA